MMRTSQAGLTLVKRNEGCRLAAYLCPAGVPTIGYGDTGPDVHLGLRITQQEAEERLARRLAREFEPGVLDALQGAPTTQAQFDALASLAYNIGVRGFAKSSVARLHREGRHAEAADAFRLYNKGRVNGELVVLRGLSRRREEERELYLSGGDLKINNAPAAAPAYDRYRCAKAMQMALQQAGLYRGRIDGDWGRRSREAYALFDRPA